MPDPYKPNPAAYDNRHIEDVGYLMTEFEVFDLNPRYGWSPNDRSNPRNKNDWPIVVPKGGPMSFGLPQMVENLIKSTWTYTEPSRPDINDKDKPDTILANKMPLGFANRDNRQVAIGLRDERRVDNKVPQTPKDFSAQTRPVRPPGSITTTFPNSSAIASDWKTFNSIKRTNAVTFRGDTRSPYEVISKSNGFNPPNSRTDRYYLENNIHVAFNDYLTRRYNRPALSQAAFLAAVDKTVRTSEEKKLLVDYMMWRKICEREAVHLGRMVESECLKGYISTARAIETSLNFGTNFGKKDGWLYLVVVHGGFVVPMDMQMHWSTQEAEIAQWGPIPAERIVGFMQLKGQFSTGFPMSKIFMRKSFRKNEPKAFETMLDVMSGKTP